MRVRSAQVLNEYYVTITRKLQPGMSLSDAQADINNLMSWNPLPITGELISRAWTVENGFGFPFWAALIVAAAQRSGCRHLLAEDLQDGRTSKEYWL